jgi:hypothetical protein
LTKRRRDLLPAICCEGPINCQVVRLANQVETRILR